MDCLHIREHIEIMKKKKNIDLDQIHGTNYTCLCYRCQDSLKKNLRSHSIWRGLQLPRITWSRSQKVLLWQGVNNRVLLTFLGDFLINIFSSQKYHRLNVWLYNLDHLISLFEEYQKSLFKLFLLSTLRVKLYD